ncbi:MAG: hypothetical protein Q9172_002553 [Xanthocarpia lactea]
MPYSSVIEGVSGYVTRGGKSVPQSTLKRCTVCPVTHNSSTAHEKRLGLYRMPGTPSLFNRLAPELRVLVYRHLVIRDVLRLRWSCRSLLNLVELDMGEIVRCLVMDDGIMRLAHSLAKDGIETSIPTVGYLVALSHRCHVAEALGRSLATFHLQEIYSCNSSTALARSPHAHKVAIVNDNLRPYLVIISHMLEVYRSSMAKVVQEKNSVEETRLQACRSERAIMKQYTSDERTPLVIEFLKKTLFRQLRPASYATFLERRIRGWTEPSANDDKVMSLIVFGGVDAIRRVLGVQNYNMRIRALEDWLSDAGVTERSRSKTDEAIKHRSANHGLGPATIQRIKAILPDRSRLFATWAPGEPITIPKPDSGEFLLWLRTEHVGSDFRLR